MLPRPGTDAFPPSAPHTVPDFSGTRWPATLSRWWREVFARNPYARGGGATGRGPRGHRPFAHLIDRAEEAPADVSGPAPAEKA
jgi:hypothetical protein